MIITSESLNQSSFSISSFHWQSFATLILKSAIPPRIAKINPTVKASVPEIELVVSDIVRKKESNNFFKCLV